VRLYDKNEKNIENVLKTGELRTVV